MDLSEEAFDYPKFLSLWENFRKVWTSALNAVPSVSMCEDVEVLKVELETDRLFRSMSRHLQACKAGPQTTALAISKLERRAWRAGMASWLTDGFRSDPLRVYLAQGSQFVSVDWCVSGNKLIFEARFR
jgi:hypothetical protein